MGLLERIKKAPSYKSKQAPRKLKGLGRLLLGPKAVPASPAPPSNGAGISESLKSAGPSPMLISQDGAGFGSVEMKRVLTLPIEEEMPSEEIQRTFNLENVLAGAYESGFRCFPEQVKAVRSYDEHGVLFAPMSCGSGKGGCKESHIVTPSGVTTYGEVQVGDLVIGSDGKPCTVTGVFPRGKIPAYKVSFTDNSSVVVDGEHLWKVGVASKWFVRPQSTLEMYQKGVKSRRIWKDGTKTWIRKYKIPMVKPVEFEPVDVPLDPYTLGVLLGDGSITQGCPSVCLGDADVDIAELMVLPGGDFLRPRKRSVGKAPTFGIAGGATRSLLKEMSLWGKRSWEKHVPAEYLWNEVPVRLSLLQGLLDTDGGACKDKGGQVEYSTSSGDLMEAVVFLVQSLGGTATVGEKAEPVYEYKGEKLIGRLAYRVMVRLPTGIEPFRCARKSAEYEPPNQREPYRCIDSIEPVGDHEMICISVDAPDSLYVTEDFIVTHNTIVTMLVAVRAFRKNNEDRNILLVVPPEVFPQFWERDLPNARMTMDVAGPWERIYKVPLQKRVPLILGSPPSIWVMPTTYLSTQDADEMLEALLPATIIVDEAHLVANRNAARTKRLVRHIRKYWPEFIPLSGTITKRSIRDYHHLVTLALGDYAPVPLRAVEAADWGNVVDARGEPSSAQIMSLTPLYRWYRKTDAYGETKPREEPLRFDVEGMRESFKARLQSAPGVVATSGEVVATSLLIKNIEAEPPGDRLMELINDVETRWVAPNGDEIEFGFHKHKWLYEMSSGFYNDLFWPEPDVYAARKKISIEEAFRLLEDAKLHHAAAQVYHRFLRGFLRYTSRSGLDTPLLVASNMAKNGSRFVPEDLYGAWLAMRELQYEGLPKRDSLPVRIDPFKINLAEQWAKDYPAASIIWYHHKEVGIWLMEALEGAKHFPAGDAFNSSIVDEGAAGPGVAIVSVNAHGMGKNLQHFKHQLYLDWPRASQLAEQSLARTHRPGQVLDHMDVHTAVTLHFEKAQRAATLRDALYVQESTGSRQRWAYADKNPLPEEFSSDELRRMGFRLKTKS